MTQLKIWLKHKTFLINKTMKKNLFSSIRFRQIINDLKRRPEDAARELKISIKEINEILSGKSNLNLKTVVKILKTWPVHIDSLINNQFLSKDIKNLKIFRKEQSKKTARIMKRKGKDYYEYRDTVMDRFAPFRPEWIRTICYVENNNPKNKKVIWNKGHLLHQFTYFIGNINFYYIDANGNKKVSKMKTGDSMYISPYVPHSFASRDHKLNFIIALTYLDKINIQLQDNLNQIGKINVQKSLIDVVNLHKSKEELINRHANNLLISKDEIKKRIKKTTNQNKLNNYADIFNINLRDLLSFDKKEKVIIKKRDQANSWYYPSNKQRFLNISELASSKFVPEAKALEIKVIKKNKLNLESYGHQYIYILSDSLILKINSKKYTLKKDDTFYLKPLTKFIIENKNAKILILRVPGIVSGENLLQLSQIGKKNISRIINENNRWY